MSDSILLAAIIDVTGHGYEASQTAAQIEAFFSKCRPGNVERIKHRAHEAIGGTRGASIGLCLIDTERDSLEYAGTGNTVFRRLGDQDTRLVSRDGVVGVNMHSPKVQNVTLENRDLILMYTDGVLDQFRLDPLSRMQRQSTTVIANRVVSEFAKDYDDAGCIAMRYRKSPRFSHLGKTGSMS